MGLGNALVLASLVGSHTFIFETLESLINYCFIVVVVLSGIIQYYSNVPPPPYEFHNLQMWFREIKAQKH